MQQDINFYHITETPGLFYGYSEVLQDLGQQSEVFTRDLLDILENKVKFFLFDYYGDRAPKKFYDGHKNSDILVFDHNYEGWSPTERPIAQTIHETLERRKHNLNHVFYISGNFREKQCYDKWCIEHNKQKQINIIEICLWDTSNYVNYAADIDHLQRRLNRTRYIKSNFIYLSRRARPHRTLLTKELYDNNLIHQNIISHDVVEEGYLDNPLFSDHDFEDFKKTLPIIADTKDFETNWANFLCDEIHLKAYFSVVGETLQDDLKETSMFVSEKTFRPMYLGMPFLIWGQKGCNEFLFDTLGYKSYDAWFDYGFDSIEDNTKRCKELTKQLVSINKMLNSFSNSQKIDWALKDLTTLRDNRKRTKYNEVSLSNFKSMISRIIDAQV